MADLSSYRQSPRFQEEAFSIWTEWEHLYPLKTKTRELLSNLVLISVVHHDFKNPNGLWDFLLDE
jgi:methylenetetrahydrofolate reductase (NADPH)